MPNHIHLVWQLDESRKLEDVQRDFLKFCGQKIKFDLADNHPAVLERFRVDAKDWKYQIWERNPRVTDLYSIEVIEQKLNYIHNNPLQAHWNLGDRQENYFYSSARFYFTGIDDFGFLTHYRDDF